MRCYATVAVTLMLFASLVCHAAAQDSDPTMSAAGAAYDAQHYEDAVSLYQEVIASALPDDMRADAMVRLGNCYFALKDVRSAKAEWLLVPDEFPRQSAAAAEALVRCGNLAVFGNDYDSAFNAYKRVSDEYASDPEAARFAAEAVCRLGKVYLHMAEAAKRAGPEGEVASKAWERAASYFEMSRQSFERVTKDFAGVEDWAAESEWQMIALKYEWAFNQRATTFDDVIAAADKFLEEGHDEDVWHLPKVHLIRAEALVQKHQYAKAIPELLIIREKYSATAAEALGTSRYFLARSYEATGAHEKAIAEYKTLMEGKEESFDPKGDHAAAEWNIANILKSEGKSAEAKAWYLQLKADHPDTFWSRFADEGLAGLRGGNEAVRR